MSGVQRIGKKFIVDIEDEKDLKNE